MKLNSKDIIYAFTELVENIFIIGMIKTLRRALSNNLRWTDSNYENKWSIDDIIIHRFNLALV